jgi:hypothetical protein
MTIDLKHCAALAGAIYDPASKWDWEFNCSDLRVGGLLAPDGSWTIVPRGTVVEDVRDLERDGDFIPTDAYALGWLHRGFFGGAVAFAGAVDRLVGDAPVRGVGHSLAAAMILIYCCLRVLDGKRVDWATTFGCPRIAFSPFGRKTKLEDVAAQFGGPDLMHAHDPVTKVPGGFNHARFTTPLPTIITVSPVTDPLAYHAIAGYEADCPA